MSRPMQTWGDSTSRQDRSWCCRFASLPRSSRCAPSSCGEVWPARLGCRRRGGVRKAKCPVGRPSPSGPTTRWGSRRLHDSRDSVTAPLHPFVATAPATPPSAPFFSPMGSGDFMGSDDPRPLPMASGDSMWEAAPWARRSALSGDPMGFGAETPPAPWAPAAARAPTNSCAPATAWGPCPAGGVRILWGELRGPVVRIA